MHLLAILIFSFAATQPAPAKIKPTLEDAPVPAITVEWRDKAVCSSPDGKTVFTCPTK